MIIIKTIVKLEVADASDLQRMIAVPGRGVILHYVPNFVNLPLDGTADCTINSNIENKSTIFTTNLKAWLCQPFSVDGRSLCFRITAADGTKYLVGTCHRPYPKVTVGHEMPAEVTSKSGCTINISYTDTIGLTQVID